MKKLLGVAAVAVAVALTGCVSAPIKTVDSAVALQGKTIIVSEYAKPGFTAMTAGKAMFGLLGAGAMVAAGNQLVKQDEIPDPSRAVAAKIAEDLDAARGDTLHPNGDVVAANDNVTTLQKTYPGADLIVDVKTIGWMYSYYPSHWDKYHVLYNARLRILDDKTGKLIAQAMCKVNNPADPATAPTHDQLLADHGKRLKSLLQEAGDQCVALYEKQVLKV